MVTCALGMLNVFAFTVCFGDWAYAASDPHSDLQAFESILLYCVTCVSALLACMFLAYGGLLFFQVQAIIRASSESVASGGGAASFMPPSKTQSRVGANGYAPLRGGRNAFLPVGSFSHQTRPQSLLLPGGNGGNEAFSHSAAAPLIPNMSFVASEAGTGFTPNHAATAAKKEKQQQQQQQRRNGHAEGERADHDGDEPVSPDGQSYDEGASDYLAPAPAGVGNGLRPGTGTSFPPSTGFQPRAQGQSPSSDNSSHNGLNGFASPNLPIGSRANGANGGEVVVAHSYVSSIGNSVSPSAVGGAGGGPGAPGGANGEKGSAAGGVGGAPKLPSGYASSVSPEYSQLPNSTKARTHAQHSRAVITSPNGTTQIIATTHTNSQGTPNTPTDQLVGSMQAAPVTPVRSSHRGATSSLARQSPVTPTSSRLASQQPRYSPNDSLETVTDDSIEATPGLQHPGKQGLTNAHYTYTYQMNDGVGHHQAYPSSAGAGRGKAASNQLNSVVAARYDENSYRDRGDDSTMSHNTAGALLLPASPPPNPMRKIAVIAAICTACLIARAILLAVVMGCGLDFNAGTTLIYFATSEIFPLVFMLRVFNTPSPLVYENARRTCTGA